MVRLKIANQILDIIEKKASIQIDTFPGNGCGYFIENLLTNNYLKFQFVDLANPPANLIDINIITLNQLDPTTDLRATDNLFKQANSPQKFILINELPFLDNNQSYTNSYTNKHIYQKIVLPSLSLEETSKMINNLSPNINNQTNKIYQLTGGISRFIKQICIDPQLISDQIDQRHIKLIKPVFDIIYQSPSSNLRQLNLVDTKNKYLSLWLGQYCQKYSHDITNIVINPDLTVQENQQLNPAKLTKSEVDILTALLANQIVDRDKISQIKWGNLSLEKYSDEAINKTISRLNQKLQSYVIRSVPKLGYKLTKK